MMQKLPMLLWALVFVAVGLAMIIAPSSDQSVFPPPISTAAGVVLILAGIYYAAKSLLSSQQS